MHEKGNIRFPLNLKTLGKGGSFVHGQARGLIEAVERCAQKIHYEV